jgi:hypothetical protein
MQPLTPEPQGAGLGAPPFSGVVSAEDTICCGVTFITGTYGGFVKWIKSADSTPIQSA